MAYRRIIIWQRATRMLARRACAARHQSGGAHRQHHENRLGMAACLTLLAVLIYRKRGDNENDSGGGK